MRNANYIRVAALALVLGLPLSAGVSPLMAGPIDSIAKKISSAGEDLRTPKIAVLPFPFYDGRQSPASGAVAERLVAGILDHKKVEVVERGRTENLMRELTWQSMGAVDQQMIRQAGRVLGVEAVVAGTLIEIDEKHVEIVAHLVMAETGEVLASVSGEVKHFWKEASAAHKMDPSVTPSAPVAEPAAEPAAQPAGAPAESAPATPAAPTEAASNPAPAEASVATELVVQTSGEPAPVSEPVSAPSRPRNQDIILDTRGQGGLTNQDYDLLASNWPTEVKQGGDNSQLMEGFRLLKQGDASRAYGIFTLLERRYKKQPALRATARLGLSLCQFQQGRKSAAASLASSVSGQTDYPGISAAAHYVLGRYAETFGRHRKARGHFLDAIRSTPFQTALIKAAAERVKRLEAIFARD